MENMQFDPNEFHKRSDEYCPITLDTYTNEENNLCLKFCPTHSSFLKHPVVGETVILCPTSLEQVLQMLQHFENVKLRSFLETR